MKTRFLVYKNDNFHSYASRDIIGVATTFLNAIKLCRAQAKKENIKLTEYDLFNLKEIKQTQGYEGEGEFFIEEVNQNQLI